MGLASWMLRLCSERHSLWKSKKRPAKLRSRVHMKAVPTKKLILNGKQARKWEVDQDAGGTFLSMRNGLFEENDSNLVTTTLISLCESQGLH